MKNKVTHEELASILAGLESPEEELRRMSVEQLVLLPEADALPLWMDRLGDEVWRVRKAAVSGLVASRERSSVHEALVRALSDGENPGRRNSAFEALVACGLQVTGRLLQELASDDVDVRKLVIDALAAIGDPASRAGLVEATRDADPNVRGAAAEALGVIGGEDEIDRLIESATDTREEALVRLSAIGALVRMEAKVEPSELADSLGDPLLRPAALELLGHSDCASATDELLKGLGDLRLSSREAAMGGLLRMLARLDGSEADRLRRQVWEAAASDDRLVQSACDRLDCVDLVQRMMLIQFLGLLEDRRVVLPILRAGHDDALGGLTDAALEGLGPLLPEALGDVWDTLDSDLKRRACRVLGRAGGRGAERLLASALSGPDPELRCEAALAVGRGGYLECFPDVLRNLESAAHDDAVEARDEVAAMVEALVEMAGHADSAPEVASSGIVELLGSRLGEAPEPVRLAIARVLARVGRPRDQQIIGYLLKDESPAVRRAAVKALSLFGFEETEESLRLALVDESGGVRIAAAQVLGASGRQEAIEDLEPLLMDEDPNVIAVALRAIGSLHADSEPPSDQVFEMMESFLEATPVVALAACEALLDMGGSRAAELACSMLDRSESEIVRAAVACLAAHAGPDELDRLIGLVAHPDWSVRAEVIQLLGDRSVRRSLPALLGRLEAEKDDFVREAILRSARRLEE